jgi:hypothetical protein
VAKQMLLSVNSRAVERSPLTTLQVSTPVAAYGPRTVSISSSRQDRPSCQSC